METNCQSTSRASALHCLADRRSMCRSCLQCILSSKWCAWQLHLCWNVQSCRRYYQIRIDVLRRKIQESFVHFCWCERSFVELWFCDLHRSLAHRWFCPIFLQEKDQHIDDALKKMDFAEEVPLMCQLSAIVPLSGFWSWANPLSPWKDYLWLLRKKMRDLRHFGSLGQKIVTRLSYLYVCEFLLLLPFSSPQPFMTQGHFNPSSCTKVTKVLTTALAFYFSRWNWCVIAVWGGRESSKW